MENEKRRVFYSWQSDTPSRENRNLIQNALERAIKNLAAELELSDRPIVQTSSSGVVGARSIAEVIFERIRSTHAFVADVSLVVPATKLSRFAALRTFVTGRSQSGSRLTPNPNVLLETGYALHALGEGRMVLVANTAFGPIEDLPFDLRGRLSFTYEAHADAALDGARKRLVAGFQEIIGGILTLAPKNPDVRVDVGVYDSVSVTGELGGSVLAIAVRNFSEFPIRLTFVGFEKPEGGGFTLAEVGVQLAQPIPPRDSRTITVPPQIVQDRDDIAALRVAVKDSLDRTWYTDRGALADAFAAYRKSGPTQTE